MNNNSIDKANNKGLVSIIIPIYNTRKYINRCINSILNQSYSNYEVILVNDGSNDDSYTICNNLSEMYPEKITVINSVHVSQGNARNIGLDNAKGEYVLFVDSDDTIHKNMILEMVSSVIDTNSDICICDVKMFFNDKDFVIQKSLNWGEYEKKNYIRNGINLCSPCNKLFKKSMWNKVCFSNMKYEDMAIIPILVSKAEKISFVMKHFYEYRLRPDSTTGCNNPFPTKDYCRAVKSSIYGVTIEYRNEMICWQARSFIDILKRISADEKNELICWLKNNQELFNIPEIEKDLYLKRIVGSLVDKTIPVPSELELKYRLTIILREYKELIKTYRNDIQILNNSSIFPEIIKGRFILVVDYINESMIDTILSLCDLCENFRTKTDLFLIPQKSEAKLHIADIYKEYKKINPLDYAFVYSYDFYCCNYSSINILSVESSFYALMLQPNVLILNNQISLLKSIQNENAQFESLMENRILMLCNHLINHSIDFCMGVPVFVQYWVARYIKEFIETRDEISDYSLKEVNYYKTIVKTCLENIHDDILLSLPCLTPEHKLFFMNYKYESEAEIKESKTGCGLWHNGNCIYNQENTYTMLEFCSYDGSELIIEGRTIALNARAEEKIIVIARCEKKEYVAEILERECSRFWLDEILFKGTEFRVKIPIDSNVGEYKISFLYYYRGVLVQRKDIRFGKYFPINSKIKSSYYKTKDRVLTFVQNSLSFRLCGKKGWIEHERNFLKEINSMYPQKCKEIGKLRKFAILLSFIKFKPIWLVSDKAHRADDNGEAFFSFLNKRLYRRKINSYYIFQKESLDYKRMKKIGKIVEFNSFKHKLLSLICQYQFAAYVHVSIVCPLADERIFFQDLLCTPKVVFLQHGVTQNNLSKALNKYNQNFAGIVTANKDERESFLKYKYFYNDDIVKLLGFARYDRLISNTKKYITFAPTWRRYLFGEFIQAEERYPLNEDFENSDYYNFYKQVVTSERLKEVLMKNGYEIHFIPHPVFFPYANKFQFDDNVVVHGPEVSYRTMFEQSSLFITDYSSAVFDFAYMKKPVIYTQFDQKDFYATQYEKGDFDYITQGFGKVVYNVKETVDTIIEYVNCDCKMEEKYRARVDTFFEYRDKNNSKRIFDAFFDTVT